MEKLRYQPIGVRKALTEMKDLSELMVDLAYSAVLFNDREIAEDVRELESQVERLRYILGMNAMISVRDAQDAELMAPITMAASAANKISDAAADIANIVLLNLGLHPSVLEAFQEVDERVARVRVFEESVLVGKTLAKLRLPIKFGSTIIAVRRKGEWILDPSESMKVEKDDFLIAYGSRTGVEELRRLANPKQPSPAPSGGPAAKAKRPPSLIEVERELAELKDTSELMVDLAYSALLFNDADLAKEVIKLEEHVDQLHTKYELKVLSDLASPDQAASILGMLRLGVSTENIADAALVMARPVALGLHAHPVLQAAIDASDEIVTRVKIPKASKLAEKTLEDLKFYDETGMWVVAIRRGKEWIYHPGGSTQLKQGDSLIVRGEPEGKKVLQSLAGETLGSS